ncbi:hypothetical protein OH76DRAFT_1110301 [Lentinus brumalis]|uniref:Uncharacterized protein n=1 Tax=Lentinus brumalis TaxID=2498619 RepID=A0A371CV74_9APHY|nr:hypothetical protein OH76DRAFT_1110301 [Polyporus brumalis]
MQAKKETVRVPSSRLLLVPPALLPPLLRLGRIQGENAPPVRIPPAPARPQSVTPARPICRPNIAHMSVSCGSRRSKEGLSRVTLVVVESPCLFPGQVARPLQFHARAAAASRQSHCGRASCSRRQASSPDRSCLRSPSRSDRRVRDGDAAIAVRYTCATQSRSHDSSRNRTPPRESARTGLSMSRTRSSMLRSLAARKGAYLSTALRNSLPFVRGSEAHTNVVDRRK